MRLTHHPLIGFRVAEAGLASMSSIMKNTKKCPKCSSTEIISDAKAIDRGHSDFQRELSVATFGKPDALVFKDKHLSTVSAWVCAKCGYVEFYADAPADLKLARA